jgi:hypothetical protein
MTHADPFVRRSAGLANLLLLLIFAVSPSRAQPAPSQDLPSVDKILEHSIAATGGREAWLRLTSMHIKSDVSVSDPQMNGTLEIFSQAPDQQSECFRLQAGVFFCRAFDGKNGWSDSSNEGLKDLEGKELEEIKRDADFYSELDRKRQYRDMKVTGDAEFDGLKVYVIQAVRSDGQRQELYFAKDTGLHAGTKDLNDDASQVKTSYFEDYQQVAGPAVKIPTKLRVVTDKMNMRVVITEVEPNVRISSDIFKKPAKSARDSSGSGVPGVPDNGKVAGDVYENSYFSFRYTMPRNWTVHGEETNKALQQIGNEIISGEDENKKARMRAAEKRTYNLLTVFEYPLGTPGKDNAGLQLIAEGVSFAPGIKTGADYIWTLKQVLKNSAAQVSYDGEPAEVKLSGVTFFRQSLANTVGTVLVYETIFSTVAKGYALSFIFTARSKEKLEEVTRSMSSFQSIAGAASKP